MNPNKTQKLPFGQKVSKISTKTSDQEALLKLIRQGLETGEGPFADIFGKFDEKAFEQGVSEPALKNFQEKILPMISSKFAGQHGSTGYQQALTRGASDLQSQLAQLMYNAQQQQGQNRTAGVQNFVGGQNQENVIGQPNNESIWKTIIPAAGTAAGSFLGPIGAAVGGAAGKIITDKAGI